MVAVRAISMCAIALVAVFSTAFASVAPPEVERAFGQTQLVGAARYQRIGIALFDAALWSESGAFSWERPFALSLTYTRTFSAEALADRSVQEMSARGATDVDRLRGRLRACFADVRRGDRITGISTGPNTASFFYNGLRRCRLEHPGFSRAFFGIWLDRTGANRRFSQALRGEAT